MDLKELKYTKSHEWILVRNKEATVGITDFAATRLGDIVFLDLAGNGTRVKSLEKVGEIESVKAVSEIFSPVSGEVTEVNGAAKEDPAVVNRDPFGEGWLVKLRIENASELGSLLSYQEYQDFLGEEGQEK